MMVPPRAGHLHPHAPTQNLGETSPLKGKLTIGCMGGQAPINCGVDPTYPQCTPEPVYGVQAIMWGESVGDPPNLHVLGHPKC